MSAPHVMCNATMVDYAPANGFGNQILALRVALRVALLLNRTLVLSPYVPRNYTNPTARLHSWNFDAGDCRHAFDRRGSQVPSAREMINRTVDFSTRAHEHGAYVPMWSILDRSALESILPVLDRREVEQHCLRHHRQRLERARVSNVDCTNALLVNDATRHRQSARCPTQRLCPQVDVRTEFGASEAPLIRFGTLFRTSDFAFVRYQDQRPVRAADVTMGQIASASVTFSPPLRRIGCAVTAALTSEYGDLVVAFHLRGDDSTKSLLGPSMNKSLKFLASRLERVAQLFARARAAGDDHGKSAALFLVSNLELRAIEIDVWWQTHFGLLQSNLTAIGIDALKIRTLDDFPWAQEQALDLLPGAALDARALVEIVVAASAPGGFDASSSTFSGIINEQRAFAPPCLADASADAIAGSRKHSRKSAANAAVALTAAAAPPTAVALATAAPTAKRASSAPAKCEWSPTKSSRDFCEAFTQALRSGRMPKDSLLVDVGAAFGWEAQIARRHAVRVLSFECRADEFATLMKLFGSDRGHHIAHTCLSNVTGTATLFRAQDSSSLHASSVKGSKESRKAHREANKTEEVNLVLLDDFLAAGAPAGFGDSVSPAPWPPVGFLKVDTQGHDEAVLRGAIRMIQRDRPYVLYEDMFAPPEMRGGVLLQNLVHDQYDCRKWGNPAWNSFCTPR